MIPIIELASELIRCPSITPKDAGCQDIIAKRLKAMGFTLYSIPHGEVENLLAIRTPIHSIEKNTITFAFAGHTDVVPPGNLAHWSSPPFTPTIKDGYLYGRGSADMKGSLAAMIIACERFVSDHPNTNVTLAFLITSDEEGDAKFGTQKIMEFLSERNISIQYCLVGEPSCVNQFGDTIKNGRRGSMTGKLKVKGKQGHIAYPDRAENPIHRIMRPLEALTSKIWDQGNEYFPPTSFQISNIQAGTGAGNVIPGSLECLFNFRFNPLFTAEKLQNIVKEVLESHSLNYEIEWQIFGNPFLTEKGMLTQLASEAIYEITGIQPQLSTTGGTSDARFIAGPNTEVIEFGPCNDTIHEINERVNIEDLQNLTNALRNLLIKISGNFAIY